MEQAARESGGERELSHEVHAAGTFGGARFNWRYFLLLNVVAGGIAAAIIWFVFAADSLEPFWLGTAQWFFSHPGVAALLAVSPLLMSLVVGWGYSQRARRRKAAEAARTSTTHKANEGSESAASTDEAA